MGPRSPRRWLRYMPIAVALAAVLVQSGLVVADGPPQPVPNPLGPSSDPRFSPVPNVNIMQPGPAASIHGDPLLGSHVFAQNCAICHNTLGIGNLPNPGSDDGTVPPVNPIDPGFLQDSQGNAAVFARDIDVFIQHGSRPAGPSPQLSMIPWGDKNLLSQQDIANVEAFVMQMNGVYWPDRPSPPALVEISATRSDGDVTSYMTYKIWVENHGTGALANMDLVDSLPEGLIPVASYLPAPGQNPAHLAGSKVEWFNSAGIPDGGIFGPFVIIAQLQDPRATIAPNSATVSFTWQDWKGNTFPGSASSAQVNATSGVAAAAPAPSAAAPGQAQMVEPKTDPLSWGYQPNPITVKAGDTVTWTNSGSLAHSVTADDNSFDSGLVNAGSTFSHTFSAAGTFAYHCTPHPWMKATVIVQ
jgi:uncharacterized repeat protein (TIGR01451 family)